jgi:tRNA-Thr(GGU) m(6)t(6)A37 methyltransferase TsaA
MEKPFQIFPIGIIREENERVTIEIYKHYADALHGLQQFSHIIVCYWFHENDMPHKRNTLKVHPRGNKANPLTGVFATHSPVRPNLIGLSTCKILSISGTIIHIDSIDALDGTPVIDLKPRMPDDCPEDIRAPDWV